MKKYTSILILVLMFGVVSTAAAAELSESFTEKQIENLINGIHSDNNGLMRSSVYFAGKYKVSETTDALLEKLKSENEPSNIILIALAIYEIGDKDAMMKVIDTANNSSNMKVKQMLSAIGLQFLAESGMQYVLR